MGTQRAVDAATFNAQDDAEIDRDPLNFRSRATICTPGVALVSTPNLVEQLGRVFLVAVAIGSDVRWPGADSDPPVNAIGVIFDRASVRTRMR